jgi:thioredoxin-related protein
MEGDKNQYLRGWKKTRRYQIRSVPTIILTNKKGQMGIIPGASREKKYLEAV